MSESAPPVDLVFLWHHHQPDYRLPREGRSELPWVRLHATKDYLDMALWLERHPKVRSTFNFVPALVDQLEAAVAGAADLLFDLLAQPVGALDPAARAEIARRCSMAPRHAFERWPQFRQLAEGPARQGTPPGSSLSDAQLLELEAWFLLAWIDPLFHGEPALRAVLEKPRPWGGSERDALLVVHRALWAEVLPAYRRLLEKGQVELTTSPYYHPILPLLVDLEVAKRAQPALSLPQETLRAPEDARWQVERARQRHREAFGAEPLGLWPSEGGVSPEVAGIVAQTGIRWMATDEGVLWASLPESARRREMLYRPWKLKTDAGEIALLFRDHELSDRIGFVYHRWAADQAVADFVGRLRRIAKDFASSGTPLVSVILDGENCWESYPEDGGPFLDRLYQALGSAPDIRTWTPSQALSSERTWGRLERLHSGSWIDANFRIWIGHPEKNRAWELVARARRALVEKHPRREDCPAAWEALSRAEGSDWFWWFGDDHSSEDQNVFDELFRKHLQDCYESAGIPAPGALRVPVAARRDVPMLHQGPLGFVRPTIDGRLTHFYEWHAAGRWSMRAGGTAMHRDAGLVRELHYGFDPERLFLRIDFDATDRDAGDRELWIEIDETRGRRLVIRGLGQGPKPMVLVENGQPELPLAGAEGWRLDLLELAIPFAELEWKAGDHVELLAHLVVNGQPVETVPQGDVIRFRVPDRTFEAENWSV